MHSRDISWVQDSEGGFEEKPRGLSFKNGRILDGLLVAVTQVGFSRSKGFRNQRDFCKQVVEAEDRLWILQGILILLISSGGSYKKKKIIGISFCLCSVTLYSNIQQMVIQVLSFNSEIERETYPDTRTTAGNFLTKLPVYCSFFLSISLHFP